MIYASFFVVHISQFVACSLGQCWLPKATRNKLRKARRVGSYAFSLAWHVVMFVVVINNLYTPTQRVFQVDSIYQLEHVERTLG